MNKKLMFGSATAEWGTPRDLWVALDREFHFTVDLAAADYNAKCKRFYSAADSLFDHLTEIKNQVCWLNPVYGRAIRCFIEAAIELHHRNNTVVILPPARTDTAWWSLLHKHADEVRLIRGRLRFEKPDGTTTDPAPFPSALIVLRPRPVGGHVGAGYKVVELAHYIAHQQELIMANQVLFDAEEAVE